MHRALLVLLAGVLPSTFLPVLPVGAVGGLDGAADEAVVSLGREQVLTLIDQRLATGGDAAGARAVLDVVDAVPGFDALFVDEGSGETSGDLMAEPMTQVRLVGDLDGDGHSDVIAAAWEPREEGYVAELTARRGSDGAELWTEHRVEDDWEAWVPYAVGDLTGDGIPDLLEVNLWWHETWGETCDDSGCVETWQEHDELFWVLRSGADGTTTALSRTHGAVTWESGYRSQRDLLTSTSSTWRSREIDLPEWPAPVGDQNGDGAGDLLLSRVYARLDTRTDDRQELAGVSSSTDDHFGWTGRLDARVVRSDGALIRDLSGTIPGFASWTQPMVASGSEPAALLITGWEEWSSKRHCERHLVTGSSCTRVEDGEHSFTTIVLEPRTFEERFRAHTAHWIADYAIPDVTGDGVADIATSWSVHSGADGQRWSPLDGREWLSVLRDGRAARPVALEVRHDVEDIPCRDRATTLIVDRVDGTTGETLESTKHYQDDCEDGSLSRRGAFAVGDYDGDDVRDVAILEDWGPTRIESALGGTLDVVLPGTPTQVRGDFDGDGVEDLVIRRTGDRTDGSYDPGEAVVSMPSGTVLWDVGARAALGDAGDVDGDGVDDAIVRRYRLLEEGDWSRYEAWSEVVRGNDGTVLWRTEPAVFHAGDPAPQQTP